MTDEVAIIVSRRLPEARAFAINIERELAAADFAFKVAMGDPFDGLDLVRQWVAERERDGARIVIVADVPPGYLVAVVYASTRLPVLYIPGDRTGGPCEVPVATIASGIPADAVALTRRILNSAAPPPESGTVQAAAPSEKPNSNPSPAVENAPPSDSSAESPPDDDWFERIAADFRPRVVPRRQPVRRPATRPLNYSLPLRRAISHARDIAAHSGSECVPEHLIAAILGPDDGAIATALAGADISRDSFLAGLQSAHGAAKAPRSESVPFVPSQALMELLNAAKAAVRATPSRGMLTAADVLSAYLSAEPVDRWSGIDANVVERARIALESDAVEEEIRETELADGPVGRPIHELGRAAESSTVSPDAGATGPEPPTAAPAPAPVKPSVIACDPHSPDLAAIEAVCDLLLEGHLVVLPTETTFMVTADATNARAVERLIETTSRAPGRPVGVLIHSASVVRNFAAALPEAAETILDEVWPGALTAIFERRPHALKSVSPEPTIAVRIPDSYPTLAVLSMVGRPLAAIAVRDPATPADILSNLGPHLAAVLDPGIAPPGGQPTVIDLTTNPFTIRREGSLTRDRLERIAGDRIA